MRDGNMLEKLWWTGVSAVQGEAAVASALPRISGVTHIIAVGKAATAMARPATVAFPEAPCLIVTKYDHAADAPQDAEVLEAAHPVPDAASLTAGARLIEFVKTCPDDAHLLVLVSGGASALAEALPEDWDLDRLAAETQRLLASGADIHEMNTRRKEISLIKGGKLLERFNGAAATTLAISDVSGDALDVIGSGIGAVPNDYTIPHVGQIVASNAIARHAIEAQAEIQVVANDETLYGDVGALADAVAHQIEGMAPGLLILGGEPTVELPKNPGRGGRNMALGTLLARALAGRDDVTVLVAGTDGTDGPTDAAGALIDGSTWEPSGTDALAKADVYPWLNKRGALFVTGPTGTNVTDVLLAIKR